MNQPSDRAIAQAFREHVVEVADGRIACSAKDLNSSITRRAAELDAQPADVGRGDLPELPDSEFEASYSGGKKFYTAAQMRAYGEQCRAAGPVVSEEMVERAFEAYCENEPNGEVSITAMRAALTAALRGKGGERE